jgi:hypothetical protein
MCVIVLGPGCSLLLSDGIVIEGIQEPPESKDDIHLRGRTMNGGEHRLSQPRCRHCDFGPTYFPGAGGEEFKSAYSKMRNQFQSKLSDFIIRENVHAY